MSTSRKSLYPLVQPALLAHGEEFWKREVACDLHGVVVDWTVRFAHFASGVLKRKITPEMCLQLYNFAYGQESGLAPFEFWELFPKFARLTRGGYGDLPAFDGVVDQLKQIRDAGIRIRLMTHCPGASEHEPEHSEAYGSSAAQTATLQLIERLALPLDPASDVMFMSPSEKPWQMARRHIPLIIEDNPVTAIQVARGIGHGAILLADKHTPFNRSVRATGVTTLRDRKLLAETVIRFFTQLEEANALL